MHIIYGSVVNVIAGFYLGCTGVVVDYSYDLKDYDIDLTCYYGDKSKTTTQRRSISGKNLKVIKYPFN